MTQAPQGDTNMHIYRTPIRTVLLVLLVLLGLVACQSTATFFVGRTVEPALQIPLTAAPTQSGVWQTFDVVIHYDLVTDGDQLALTGNAELGEHYKRLYNRVGHLDLYLFLLDDNAAVLETASLTGSMFNGTEDEITIKANLLRPERLRAISFGYRGSVTSLDSQASFDELP